MGSGSRYNKSRSRKKKGFAGNLSNSTDNNQQQVQLPTSTSALAKKLKTSLETETSCGIAHGCNFIIDSDLFIPLVTMIGRCPECVATVNIQHFLVPNVIQFGISIFVHQKRLSSRVGNHMS